MRILFFVLSLSFLASPAFAATYDIEPSHTRVSFTISHLGFSNFPGNFHDIKGKVNFDEQKVENSSVDITINAKAVSTEVEALDTKLQAPDFFNTEKFPTITFKSTSVEKTGDDKGRVTGDLTLLGVTKPVTLNVKFNKKAFNKYMGGEQVGFSARAKILRSDFGMKAYLPDLGDEVRLYIEVEAVQPKTVDQAQDAATVKTN